MTKKNDQVIDSYNRHWHEWIALRSQTLFEKPWLDKFLNELPNKPHILDLGCGSGEPIASYLHQQSAQITGVDGAANLISAARAKMPDATWHTADMRGLDLGRRFDGILGWNSTFHLSTDEQRAMFRVFQRHAARGTVLMFTTGTKADEVMGEFAGEPIYYSSLSHEDYCALLTEHGFSLREHVSEDPSCGQHTIWLAKHD